MPLIRNDMLLLGKEAWHSSPVSCGQQRLNRFVRNYYPRQRYYSEPQGNGFQKFGKPTLFLVGSIGCIYTGAIILQEERLKFATRHFPGYFQRAMSQLSMGLDWRDVWRRYEVMRRTQLDHRDSLFARLEAWWLGIDEYYRCIAPLVVANCVVFGLWRVPRLSHMMNRYFICKPGQSSVVSLCLSTFSHQQFWHIACNMIALVSFGRFAYNRLGNEQFHAFYLSAGIFSSYMSYMYKYLVRATMIGSLGASGAVYAVMAFAIKEYPELSVSLLFLPFIPLTGTMALLGIVAFDLFGLITRKTPFDHAAHLGGAFFGYFYSPLRELLWKKYRRFLVTQYRKIRH